MAAPQETRQAANQETKTVSPSMREGLGWLSMVLLMVLFPLLFFICVFIPIWLGVTTP